MPIQNPFNPFTVADATIPGFFPDGRGLPVTTDVGFRGINDIGPRHERFTYWDSLFDVGLRGEMGEFGDYFKTWNWEAGFRYSRNEGQDLSVGMVSQPGLREALLDTDPATAFDPFLNFNAHNTKAARQEFMSPCITQANMSCQLAMSPLTATCSIFPRVRSRLLWAVSTTRRGGHAIVTRSIRRFKASARLRWGKRPGEPRCLVDLPGSASTRSPALPGTSPASTASRLTSPSARNGTAKTPLQFYLLELSHFSRRCTASINAQKPKVSVRWQPLDPKYIGALTLRGSYTEAFHAPALSEISPASSESAVSASLTHYQTQRV